MNANASTNELLEEYAKAAAEHGAYTLSGDVARGTAAHSRLAAVYRELRLRGAEHQKRLLELLCHSDDGVRLWAASHALEFSPAHGEPVLRQIADDVSNEHGLTAETVLEEWKAGTLTFP
jgi:hypothetical protein